MLFIILLIIYLCFGLAIYLTALFHGVWTEINNLFWKRASMIWYQIMMCSLYTLAWPIAIISGIIIAMNESKNDFFKDLM